MFAKCNVLLQASGVKVAVNGNVCRIEILVASVTRLNYAITGGNAGCTLTEE